MDPIINAVGSIVKKVMVYPARFIDIISFGRIKPNHITLVSLLGHLLVFKALYDSRPILAAALLTFFGLMDSLDGTLARLQKSASALGTFYDAVSDRVKEVILYGGVAYFINNSYSFQDGFHFFSKNYAEYSNFTYRQSWYLAVIVCGLSLVVSYIKAKGEMVLASSGKFDTQKLNRLFADGMARYEVRMLLVIIGLITGKVVLFLQILVVLLVITCLQRIIKISRALK